ncbi:MAG: tetratricopeptide repeat protein, partial [Candidatus Gastranaerophilales bacterium]|nr:tetratricopeptide repeat protein [Candidatus Gastranaerophilales bacterium]
MSKETYENLYKCSLVQRAKGNYVSAFEYAQKAYSINDSNVEIIMNCAFLAEQLNLTEYLVFFMERACLLKPDNEQYFLKLAFLYKNNKNNIGALQCFERCLAINNKNFLALINICEISIICKNYNLAHKYANLSLEAATKNEEFKRTHLKLSNIYQNQKNWRAALKEVRKSMKYLPVTHYDYSTLACICWEYVSYSLAVKFFFKALELCPNELDYLYNIGNCYLFQNETDKAINVTNEVLNKNPEHVLALRLLTFIWLIQKQYEQAMKTYPILLSPKVLTKLNQLDNKINNVNYIANCSRYFELHWDRQNIKNKTIFIYNDAGLGDSIMFSRFIPLIENQAGKVIIEINSNLYDIYKRSFKKSEIVLETKEGFYGKYDYSTSFMCLFYNMERDFSHIP